MGLTAARKMISWPVEMPPVIPPAWLLAKPGSVHVVVMLCSEHIRCGETLADLKPFHGPYGEDGLAEIGFQLVEDRFAQTGGNAVYAALYNSPGAVSFRDQPLPPRPSLTAASGSQALRGFFSICSGRYFFTFYPCGGLGVGADGDSPFCEDLFSHGPGCHAAGCLPAGCPSAAPPVPDAVLFMVCVVGMAGTVFVLHIVVVAADGVGVVEDHHQGVRRWPSLRKHRSGW